jgi:hypothetical protein
MAWCGNMFGGPFKRLAATPLPSRTLSYDLSSTFDLYR